MKLRLPLNLCSVVMAACVTIPYANAAKWTGGDGSWDTATMWDSGAVPTDTENAVIDLTSVITVTGDKTIAALTAAAGSDGTIKFVGAGSITTTGITFGTTTNATVTLGDGTNTFKFISSGTTTVRANADNATTLIINPNVELTSSILTMGRNSNDTSIVKQNGGIVTLTSSSSGSNAPMRLGEWSGSKPTYQLNDGELNVLNSSMYLIWDGGGKLEITGGVANLKGVSMRSDSGDNANRVGSLELTGGRLNIGSSGMGSNMVGGVYLARRTYKLGGGILGAYANWSSSAKFDLVGGETTIDTQDSVVSGTARTITLSGVVAGAGDLKKVGVGELKLTGVNEFAGTLTVDEGSLTIGNGATGSFNSANLVNNTTVTVNIDGATTMNGAISGTGAIAFNGSASNYTLGGANTYTGATTVAAGVTLTMNNATTLLNSTSQLTLGSGSNITLAQNTTASIAALSITGTTSTLDFGNLSGAKVSLAGPMATSAAGDYLIISNYNYEGSTNYLAYNNGGAIWQPLDDVMIQTSNGLVQAMINASGHVVVFDGLPGAGDLVINDAGNNTYTATRKYFGSMAGEGVLTFTSDFGFANGADPIYGFTTKNDSASGTPANSFTVDSLLVNGSGNLSRGVSIIGNTGNEDRWVAIGNTGNSFTGDLNAQSVTVRAVADVVGTVDQSNMTTLGIGNTIKLTTKATLVLDSERQSDGTASGLTGDFTYKNNIQLGQNNVYVRQDSGNHTLSGNITLLGVGDKVIENAIDNSALTLSGTITGGAGSSALTLKTLASPDSKIILAPVTDNGLVQQLNIEGHVELVSGTLTAVNGVALGTADSTLLLGGGTLAFGGTIDGVSGSSLVLADGGTLKAASDSTVSSNIALDVSGLASGETFTFDTNGYQLVLDSPLANVTSGAVIRKISEGELLVSQAITGSASLLLEGGKTTLQAGGNAVDTVQLNSGAELAVNGDLTVAGGMVMEGKLSGTGSIGISAIDFAPSGEYAGDMVNQTWDANFAAGSTFSGSLETTGDVLFENGSRFVGTIALDTSVDPATAIVDPQLKVSGGNVTLEGVSVSGNTTTPISYWNQGLEYVFVLIETDPGRLMGFDGDLLNEFNFSRSASMETTAWGAFLTGELGFVEGEQLIVTLTRNNVYVTDFAQTENQYSVGTGLNYAMDYYKELGLAGTELDRVIRYFNAMGDDIAAQAPAALEMLGGLSAYQTVAGQRTDLLRHVDAVNRRAQAGGKGVNLHRKDPANQFWVEATQSFQQVDSMSGSPGYEVATWGGAIGVDFVSAAHYSLGVGFAYSNINVSSDEYSAKSVGDALYLDLYGRFEKGPWSGTFVLSGGTTDFEVKRSVIMGDDYYNVKADPTGKQIMGMVELAYAQALTTDGLYLEPNVRLSVGTTELDGYSEEGFGNAGLDVSKHKMNILQGAIGVRLFQQKIDTYMEYETSRWEVRAGLVQEMGDKEYTSTTRFIGAPVDFRTKGSDVGATGFQIGGSISSSFDNNWSWFGDVNAEFRKGVMGMDSVLGLRCTF